METRNRAICNSRLPRYTFSVLAHRCLFSCGSEKLEIKVPWVYPFSFPDFQVMLYNCGSSPHKSRFGPFSQIHGRLGSEANINRQLQNTSLGQATHHGYVVAYTPSGKINQLRSPGPRPHNSLYIKPIASSIHSWSAMVTLYG